LHSGGYAGKVASAYQLGHISVDMRQAPQSPIAPQRSNHQQPKKHHKPVRVIALDKDVDENKSKSMKT